MKRCAILTIPVVACLSAGAARAQFPFGLFDAPFVPASYYERIQDVFDYDGDGKPDLLSAYGGDTPDLRIRLLESAPERRSEQVPVQVRTVRRVRYDDGGSCDRDRAGDRGRRRRSACAAAAAELRRCC